MARWPFIGSLTEMLPRLLLQVNVSGEESKAGVAPVDRHGRREAIEEADERCREELAAGKHRRSTLIPVMWDVKRRLVLAPAAGEAKRGALDNLFRELEECCAEINASDEQFPEIEIVPDLIPEIHLDPPPAE